jgi:hypothetical protein
VSVFVPDGEIASFVAAEQVVDALAELLIVNIGGVTASSS